MISLISPEILKNSAAAGLIGVATVGGVIAVAGMGEDSQNKDAWADPVHVSYETRSVEQTPSSERERSERRDQGRIVAPTRFGRTVPNRHEATTERRSGPSLERRNRAAHQAMDKMKDIYRSGCRGYDRPDSHADSVEATREARRKIREKYKEAVKAAHDEMTMKEKMEHPDIIVW